MPNGTRTRFKGPSYFATGREQRGTNSCDLTHLCLCNVHREFQGSVGRGRCTCPDGGGSVTHGSGVTLHGAVDRAVVRRVRCVRCLVGYRHHAVGRIPGPVRIPRLSIYLLSDNHSRITVSADSYPGFANLRHIAPTAVRSTKSKDKSWSIAETLAEADRLSANCPHVSTPHVPKWLIGSRLEVEGRAAAWHSQARQANGKKWRKTSPSLACAVLSFPRQRLQDWPKYRNDALTYFRAKLGDRVVGAVEHLDESHPHLHVYLVPLNDEPFGIVHPGYASSREARKQSGNLVTKSYKRAMVRWQDDIYGGLNRHHGLTRVGPQRTRQSRKNHRLLQEATEQAALLVESAKRTAAEVAARARKLADEVSDRAAALKAREERWEAQARLRDEQLQEGTRKQGQERQRLADWARMVQTREKELKALPQAELLVKLEKIQELLALQTRDNEDLKARIGFYEEKFEAKERKSLVSVSVPKR